MRVPNRQLPLCKSLMLWRGQRFVKARSKHHPDVGSPQEGNGGFSHCWYLFQVPSISWVFSSIGSSHLFAGAYRIGSTTTSSTRRLAAVHGPWRSFSFLVLRLPPHSTWNLVYRSFCCHALLTSCISLRPHTFCFISQPVVIGIRCAKHAYSNSKAFLSLYSSQIPSLSEFGQELLPPATEGESGPSGSGISTQFELDSSLVLFSIHTNGRGHVMDLSWQLCYWGLQPMCRKALRHIPTNDLKISQDQILEICIYLEF